MTEGGEMGNPHAKARRREGEEGEGHRGNCHFPVRPGCLREDDAVEAGGMGGGGGIGEGDGAGCVEV